MKRLPAKKLGGELAQVLSLLDQQRLFSLTDQEAKALRNKADEISGKLAAIEGSFLTVGLLGGTGVGKSTLMNGLAGLEIASASHRRPHTEQILIYRHERANPLSKVPESGVPWREITHQADPIQQVLLCDLPDFDSLVNDHRKRVLAFMEHLDVLVWVTTPEKYADGRFYEFLRLVPKAEQNFYFVLNKADLLLRGKNGEKGYEQMARVGSSFQEHIKEKGISEPLLFLVSAKEVLHADQLPPWNQFHSFRQHIFQQRDIKQVTAIKEANLDVETQQVLAVLEKEIQVLKSIERTLEDSVEDLRQQRSVWIEAGQEAIDLWLEKHVRPEILSTDADPSCLVGPGYGLATLFQRFSPERNRGSVPSSFMLPEEVERSLQSQLEWLETRLNHRILRQNLPALFRKQLQEGLNISTMLRGVTERFSRIVALRTAEPSLPALWGFRAFQLLTYLLLLALFLLAIGGESAWQSVLDNPGGTSIFRLILAGTQRLFSAKGLAALVSYGLLNFLLACRFYGRFKKLLRTAADKTLASLKVELTKAWERMLDSIMDDLNQFRADIASQASAISGVRKDRKRDMGGT